MNVREVLEKGKKLVGNSRIYMLFPHEGIQVITSKNKKKGVNLKLSNVRFVKPFVFFCEDYKIHFIFQIEKSYVKKLNLLTSGYCNCVALEDYFSNNKDFINKLVSYPETFPLKVYDLKLDPLKFLLTYINHDGSAWFSSYYKSWISLDLYRICVKQKILKAPTLIHKSFVFEDITTKWQASHRLFDKLMTDDQLLKEILNE